jgi:hydrogenase expression/formation protein HypC
MCLAAPARVIEVTDGTALVDYNGVQTTARLDALPDPVSPGDYILIHTGFAIRRLSPEDGEETLRLFDELAQSLTSEGSVEEAPPGDETASP